MNPRLRTFLRWAGYGAGAAALALALMALALRFVIMPDIDRFKAPIESMASRAVGMPVAIGRIDTAWDGITPRFTLLDIAVRDLKGATVLRLPRADAGLSWFSPVFGRVHLARLRLDGLAMEAERDANGVIRIAGQIVNGPKHEAGFGDWLLAQREIIVANGHLTWRDQRLKAPPLVLEGVDITLQNRFSQHQLVLRAQPPRDAALNLEFNASLHGKSLADLDKWEGKINARLDETSATALNTWAPWAQDIVRAGVGDIDFHLDFARGRVQSVTANTTLRAVVLQLEAGLPELRLDQLSGEIGWRQNRGAHELHAAKLIFAQPGQAPSAPANLKLSFTPAADGKGIAQGKIETEGLLLETFAALSGSIPMPQALHRQIEARKPRGQVLHAKGEWHGRDRFSLSARFANLGMEAVDGLPGMTGLSGAIEMNEAQGQFRLDAQSLQLTDPQHFRLPLRFDRAQGEVGWRREKDGTRIEIRPLQLANADLEGELQGSLTLRPDRAPEADLSAHLKRGEGRAVWRYLPREVSDDTLNWLRDSLLAGHATDVRMVLKGPLDRYPFAEGGGEFHITIPAHAARLRYAPDWPEITGIEGMVRFQGRGMRIEATDGVIEGVRLPKVTVRIDDLFQKHQNLLIDGEAAGPLPGFLGFVTHSPVAQVINHATDAMQGEGNARLQLHLNLPLEDMDAFKVNGRLQFADNRINPGSDLPRLEAVEGVLEFTRNKLSAQDLNLKVLGQPARLSLTSQPGGAVQADLTGTANSTDLNAWLPDWLTRQIRGQSSYRARVRLFDGSPVFELESDLAGMTSNLPAPLDKPPATRLPLKLYSRTRGKAQETLLHLGEVLHVRSKTGDGPERMAVRLGKGELQLPEKAGVVVSGDLDALDIDHWRAILPSNAAGSGPALAEINLSVDELILQDRIWHEARFRLKPINEGWTLKLDSREAKGGNLSFKPGRTGGPPRFDARFAALAVPASVSRPLPEAPPSHESIEGQLEIDALTVEGTGAKRTLGRMSLAFKQIPAGTEVSRLLLENDLLKVDATGFLSGHPRRKSRLTGEVSTPDAGRLAESLGYSGKLRGGATTLKLHTLEWMGNGIPKLAEAEARFDLAMARGQFLKLDPGAARLLGILSLQALPRRITLDFRDVFSEGFAFDRIRADRVVLSQGAAYLQPLHMEGPAAKVQMNGAIDLAREDLRLRVLVEPRLTDSVALASGLAGGPVAVVGVYLAQKLLNDPIGQISRFEYQVGGRWDDPEIKKIPPQTNLLKKPEP